MNVLCPVCNKRDQLCIIQNIFGRFFKLKFKQFNPKNNFQNWQELSFMIQEEKPKYFFTEGLLRFCFLCLTACVQYIQQYFIANNGARTVPHLNNKFWRKNTHTHISWMFCGWWNMFKTDITHNGQSMWARSLAEHEHRVQNQQNVYMNGKW